MNKVMKFLKEEDGATAIEYGLIAGLIAVGIILALTNLGTDLSELFGRIGAKLDGATGT
ncbi:Flp family type IVb pilin [Pigmentiphaga sp. NML080357]|uniref:Flp family type IVb pilin n=1 Tax=Pigmentiphaga sp. NML080357 TaxID=2008675 RepID=UPI000B412516|nr:Flp family type IVb pilin [Pigmentiphaga sp. NML080357]OVZ55899.1 Flp family type IVb pilin [Pigmentiphaga sp. NML080357]